MTKLCKHTCMGQKTSCTVHLNKSFSILYQLKVQNIPKKACTYLSLEIKFKYKGSCAYIQTRVTCCMRRCYITDSLYVACVSSMCLLKERLCFLNFPRGILIHGASECGTLSIYCLFDACNGSRSWSRYIFCTSFEWRWDESTAVTTVKPPAPLNIADCSAKKWNLWKQTWINYAVVSKITSQDYLTSNEHVSTR